MDLLIDTYGTKIGSTGKRIVLSFPQIKEKKEYPVSRLEKIVIMRPASLTTNAVQLALDNDVDIVYMGAFGKPIGRIFSSSPKGIVTLRRGQLEISQSEKGFELAKTFMKGKCSNQLYFIEKLAFLFNKDFSIELKQMTSTLASLGSVPLTKEGMQQLLGMEGYIAERYFSCMKKLFRFSGRKPQGRDKFNSALNYGYGILYNEIERLCLYVGLDPYLGVYHSDRYGKPSLVLDLVEEFRVAVVDMAVMPLFIEKKMGKRDLFDTVGKGQYQLSAKGKALIVKGVMERLGSKVLWKGKQYTLKQAMEQQIRTLARYFMGREMTHESFSISKSSIS
ncbi:MAG: CRISPR-associated endonuclease Cas1 [Candidatus Nomurabacteria bacterium]|nr:CRISPR-associated endonuclease Cas1 [Candidatus Nomurabacteria bacterium]